MKLKKLIPTKLTEDVVKKPGEHYDITKLIKNQELYYRGKKLYVIELRDGVVVLSPNINKRTDLIKLNQNQFDNGGQINKLSENVLNEIVDIVIDNIKFSIHFRVENNGSGYLQFIPRNHTDLDRVNMHKEEIADSILKMLKDKLKVDNVSYEAFNNAAGLNYKIYSSALSEIILSLLK